MPYSGNISVGSVGSETARWRHTLDQILVVWANGESTAKGKGQGGTVILLLPKSVVVDCDCKSASSSTTDGSQCALGCPRRRCACNVR